MLVIRAFNHRKQCWVLLEFKSLRQAVRCNPGLVDFELVRFNKKQK